MHDYAARFNWERRESSDEQVTFRRRLGPTEAFIHTSHHYLNAASSPVVVADIEVTRDELDEKEQKQTQTQTPTRSMIDYMRPRFEKAWKILVCRHPLLSARVELIKGDVDEPSSNWNFILDSPPIRSATAAGSLRFINTDQSAQEWIQENILSSSATRPWEEFASACCYVIFPSSNDTAFSLAIHALHCIATARVLVGLVDQLLALLWTDMSTDADFASWDDIESRLLPAQEDIFANLAGLNEMTDQDILLLEMTWQSDIVTDVMQPTSGLEPTGSFPPDQKSCEPVISRHTIDAEKTSRLVASSKKADVTITHLVYAALTMAMSSHPNNELVTNSGDYQPFIFYPNSIDLSKLLDQVSRQVLLTMSGYPTILPVSNDNSSETLLSLAKIAKIQYEKYINHSRFWAYTTILAWNMYKSVENLISGDNKQDEIPPSPISPASSPVNTKNGSSSKHLKAPPEPTFSPQFTSPRQYFTPSSWTSVSSFASASHSDSLQTCRPGPQVPIVNSLGDLSTIVKKTYHCAEVTDLRIVIRPDPGALGTHVWTFNDQLSLQVIANGAYWAQGDIERLVTEAINILSC